MSITAGSTSLLNSDLSVTQVVMTRVSVMWLPLPIRAAVMEQKQEVAGCRCLSDVTLCRQSVPIYSIWRKRLTTAEPRLELELLQVNFRIVWQMGFFVSCLCCNALCRPWQLSTFVVKFVRDASLAVSSMTDRFVLFLIRNYCFCLFVFQWTRSIWNDCVHSELQWKVPSYIQARLMACEKNRLTPTFSLLQVCTGGSLLPIDLSTCSSFAHQNTTQPKKLHIIQMDPSVECMNLSLMFIWLSTVGLGD